MQFEVVGSMSWPWAAALAALALAMIAAGIYDWSVVLSPLTEDRDEHGRMRPNLLSLLGRTATRVYAVVIGFVMLVFTGYYALTHYLQRS
jgi:hypothetical protein